MAANTLDISLQGREYRVACSPDEREALLETVKFLDAKMVEIAHKTNSSGERLAVMTALNLAHELLGLKQVLPASPSTATNASTAFDKQEFARRIESMMARMEAAMAPQDELF